MERRQRLMIAALVLMVVAYVGDQSYRRLYEQPLATAQQRAATLEEELRESTLETRRQQNRLPELDDLQKRSLPRNIELAVTEYRSWLLAAIDDCGLEQANLDSGAPARFRDLYTRIDFSLRTQGTLSQVTRLLHTFYNTDYLHKIRSLSLTPTSDGNVDVSVTIETLSIPSVASSDQLPSPPAVSGVVVPVEDYQVIARRNLFRPGDPPAASIKLSAITSDVDQRRQAWLSFLRTGETRILSEGDALTLDGTSLRVTQIQADAVEFDIDGRRREVRIGRTLEPADGHDSP